MLIAKDIHASYGRRAVLHDVSITISPGEIVSVVGPNGAGKSTLLKVIAGALVPESGRVTWGDSDLTHLAQFERARLGIGYLMQRGPVFSSLTVEQNLDLARVSRRNGHSKASWKEVIQHTSDLASVLGRRAGLLSAGQRQLLAITMIVMGQHRKQILLLDEPLAGLSPGPAQEILSTLRRIRQEDGVSILVVEQNLGAVIELSDRLCVLKHGVLVAEGNSKSFDTRRIEEAYFG
jgi:branched-chain amino acid transport system ATP-binding protein